MNGLLLTLPVALPFTAGLLSYFIRFPSKRAQNLWYGGIICLTTALAWLAILLVGEERVTLLHFTDTLTIALRCDGAARLFAALSATLWPFTALYACDYMRHEKHLAMFWSFFTASFGVTLGIAFSANHADDVSLLRAAHPRDAPARHAAHDRRGQGRGHQIPTLLHVRRGAGVHRARLSHPARCAGVRPRRASDSGERRGSVDAAAGVRARVRGLRRQGGALAAARVAARGGRRAHPRHGAAARGGRREGGRLRLHPPCLLQLRHGAAARHMGADGLHRPRAGHDSLWLVHVAQAAALQAPALPTPRSRTCRTFSSPPCS